MNVIQPDNDIDLEIKKMELVDYMHNDLVSTDELINIFGYDFLKVFVCKISAVKNTHHIQKISKKSLMILDDLKNLYPIDKYPEKWI